MPLYETMLLSLSRSKFILFGFLFIYYNFNCNFNELLIKIMHWFEIMILIKRP